MAQVEGSSALFKVALAMITLKASELATCDDGGNLFNALSTIPTNMNEPVNLRVCMICFYLVTNNHIVWS